MKVEQKILNRFHELIDTGNRIEQTKRHIEGQTQRIGNRVVQKGFSHDIFDCEQAYQWSVNCQHFLKNVFGENSDHYIQFKEYPQFFSSMAGYDSFKKAFAILKAAKDDYQHSYLFNLRTLIEAEVFDDFLEQAEHLLKNGYYGPAAVIAGSVLEDGLRKLCQRNNITLPAKPKVDSMNAELAKAGVYNLLTQKKITALADLRNKAAHGKWNEFSDKDVEDMIRDVRRFMEDHFS